MPDRSWRRCGSSSSGRRKGLGRSRSNLLAARHIVVALVLAGVLTQLPTFRVIGVFGQADKGGVAVGGYERALELWRRKNIATDAELAEALNAFGIAFSKGYCEFLVFRYMNALRYRPKAPGFIPIYGQGG